MAHNVYKRQKVGSFEESEEAHSKLGNSQDAGEDCGGPGNDDGNPQGGKSPDGNDSQGSEDDNENSKGAESPEGEDLRYSDYENEASEGAKSASMESAYSKGESPNVEARDEAIINCAFNARTYHMIMRRKIHCVSEEQSCVWPPMVVVCFKNHIQEEVKHRYLEAVRMKLVAEAKLESVKLIKDVCSEVPYSFNLFLLPSNGAAFVAAKAIDTSDYWRELDDDDIDRSWSFYPSYIDMCDITAGLIPESTREFLVSLPHCGMSRQEWINAPVVLLRDASILVGFGVCRYSQPEDFVNGVLLGDSHVGVTILQSTEGCSTDDDVFSCRRWNMKYVLFDGVSLFERLRQYVANEGSMGRANLKASQEDRQLMYGGKDDLLTEDSMKSLVPLVCESEVCLHGVQAVEEDDGELCSASSWYKNAQSMIQKIEKCERVLGSQSLELGASSEPFFEKLKAFEEKKMKEVEEIVEKTNVNESLMQHLWTMNYTFAAKCVFNRLEKIDKLIRPCAKSGLLCQMRQAGEEIEMKSLRSIDLELNRQKNRREQLGTMNAEAEKSIFVLREQQHKELLQRLEQNQQMRMSQLEAYINEKLKFVAGVRAAKMETESVLRWNFEHTSKAVDKVREMHISEKNKVEAQMLVANREKRKLEEQVLMAKTEVLKMKENVEKERRLMKENKLKFQAAVQSNEATRISILKQSAEMERRKFEEQIHIVENEKKYLEAKVRAAETNLQDTKVALTKVTDTLTEVTDIMNESTTKFMCAICFNNLEGCPTKKGGRDSDDSNATRKRACFLPCMHANMCFECSVAAWESHRRCPICNTLTSRKPQVVYL